MIFNPKSEKTQIQSQENMDIDPATISGPIEYLISEVKNMQYWDPEQIGDIEWQLKKYQDLLISHKNLFDPNVYQSLIDDINNLLDKIDRFNSMLNSEAMESIRKM